MNISFVICLHSSRINNLKQVIRFIEKREKNLFGSEILVNFHDSYQDILESANFHIKTICHNLQMYNKPYMCNYGVKMASNDIVCILDSDRILPENYFYDVASKLNFYDFTTTEYIKQCIKDENDTSIEENNFEYEQEERSLENKINHKNLFSGNVMFFKERYFEIGGMDESFIGYSFNDSDITQKVLTDKKNNPIYLNIDEIHLYHDKKFFFNSYSFSEYEKQVHCVTNMLKFCNKWNIEKKERYKEADLYVNIANNLKNEKIKQRFFEEYHKGKHNLFV